MSMPTEEEREGQEATDLREVKRLLDEWEEAKIEMEEGESRMTLAATELEDFGIDDPATYKLPEE